MEPFVAITDSEWLRYLSGRAVDGRLDEVNFWSPGTERRLRRFTPGEPVFFRLKAPVNAVAGYGFFALFDVLEADVAWRTFGEKNGAQHLDAFLARIAHYRRESPASSAVLRARLACTVLRDARFWERERWIQWGPEEGWSKNNQRGATARSDAAHLLLSAVSDDALHSGLAAEMQSRFELVHTDHRRWAVVPAAVREGQGTFRAKLLDAYGRRCAVTGERTEPVLAAAHIQPYLGIQSNHIQNGLLLTQEFHTLFDLGYVGVDPSHRIHVSGALGEHWSNGKRYYEYDGRALKNVPTDSQQVPSRDALAWHMECRFRS